ncbi:MAG: DUF3866 family protein [Dethiobacter sp.]|nr:DUF3866 family protein [Dethiobacter sp.]
MFSRRLADVLSVAPAGSDCEELSIAIDGETSKALNYVSLTGKVLVGDRVIVNTTAVELALGSGGYHFVLLNLKQPEQFLSGVGHILKLRYTPMQLRVLSIEEEDSPYHQVMAQAASLAGMPVAVAELHSMLAPLALLLKQEKPGIRLAYLMTDGGALPAFLSRSLCELRRQEIICGTITTGHSFGGDLEAINVYSGLLAARHVLHADVAIISMGPGAAGTGTKYGFSGLETADNINRVFSLKGQAVMVSRVSFADARERHRGISHHTLTALSTATLVSADVPLPLLAAAEKRFLAAQVKRSGLADKHRIFYYDQLSLKILAENKHFCSTMGRSLEDDSVFFLAVAAAARHLSALLAGVSAVVRE